MKSTEVTQSFLHEYEQLAAAIDPAGTLPHVSFELLDEFVYDELHRDFVSIMTDGDTRIGNCHLVTRNDNWMHFDGINIRTKEYRGKGYGLATYLSAIAIARTRGMAFETQDYSQTKHAVRIWQKLADAEIAEVITPFRLSRQFKGEPRYKGRYRIEP